MTFFSETDKLILRKLHELTIEQQQTKRLVNELMERPSKKDNDDDFVFFDYEFPVQSVSDLMDLDTELLAGNVKKSLVSKTCTALSRP